jgi:hypothetical protein
MMIGRKTVNSTTDIEYWLYRGANPYPFPTNTAMIGGGKFAKPNGWAAIILNPTWTNSAAW